MDSTFITRSQYSERRIINNRIRRNRQLRQRLLLSALVIVLFVILAFFLSSTKSHASNDVALYKHYKSVQIGAGDTLSALSAVYVNPSYNDTDSFIQEVIFINNLSDDEHLYEGNYIIVPYYDTISG